MKSSMFFTSVLMLFSTLATTASDHTLQRPDVSGNDAAELTPVSIAYPTYFPPLLVPDDNPTTEQGVALGRQIYYDELLSQGGPLEGHACATCHIQQFGFAQPGPDDPPVMPHVNLAWLRVFLWDGHKQGTLEEVMEFEVKDFFRADLALFQQKKRYTLAFKAIYGDDRITYQRMGALLAQFLRTVNSFNSPVDQHLRGELSLHESELRGFRVFNSARGFCFYCHRLGLFTDRAFHNTGLNAEFNGYDRGRYNVTQDPHDMGAFRTPTLRNVALRGPYMHDGRFTTLEEVVEFYDAGVKTSAALDPIMSRPGRGTRLNLTAQQKTDLVNFMKALTDTSFIGNPHLSRPQGTPEHSTR